MAPLSPCLLLAGRILSAGVEMEILGGRESQDEDEEEGKEEEEEEEEHFIQNCPRARRDS